MFSQIYSSKDSFVYCTTYKSGEGMQTGDFKAIVTPGKPTRLFFRKDENDEWGRILNRYAKKVIAKTINDLKA